MYDAPSLVADDIHLYVFFSNNKFIDAVFQALFLIILRLNTYCIINIAWTFLTKDALKCETDKIFENEEGVFPDLSLFFSSLSFLKFTLNLFCTYTMMVKNVAYLFIQGTI